MYSFVQPLTHCPCLSRTGEGIGRMRVRKLHKNKDREITCQLLLWAKQTQLGKINTLPIDINI